MKTQFETLPQVECEKEIRKKKKIGHWLEKISTESKIIFMLILACAVSLCIHS